MMESEEWEVEKSGVRRREERTKSVWLRGWRRSDAQFDWVGQKILGQDVLPPPSDPPEEDTCWAQAIVNVAEATYRYQWGLAGRAFPSLSVEHCIASLRTPEHPRRSSLDVTKWLMTDGVATVDDYNMHGMAATDKYNILDWATFYGKDVPKFVKDGPLIGVYVPFRTSRVDGHTSVVVTRELDLKSDFDTHAVMITGMDADCIEVAPNLIVPAPVGPLPPKTET